MTQDQAKDAALAAFESELKNSFATLVDISRKLDSAQAEQRIAEIINHQLRVLDIAEKTISAHYAGKQ